MIFRKPYALLIKRFKLIHLMLFALILYIVISINPIIGIFGELTTNGKLINYINLSAFVYISIILSIIFSISMLLLMLNKKKPSRFYLFSSIYYFVLLIGLILANNVAGELLDNKVISIQTARAYFDIARIIYWPQIIFLLFSLVRAVGFDIKSFGFEKDINDLNLSEQDREEFEISIKFDYHNLLSKIRHYLRELRYYFLENTMIIITIIILSILAVIVLIFFSRQVKGTVYNESEVFMANNFQYSINNSYLTNTNHNGEIFPDNKYYLVLDVNIKNLTNDKTKLDIYNFIVVSNNKNIYPIKNNNESFKDIGNPYQNNLLIPKTSTDKLLIFEISNYNVNDNYLLKVFDYFKYDDRGSQETVYTSIRLKPITIDGLIPGSKKFYGTTNKFDLTLLKNSSLKIIDYNIDEIFSYEYDSCDDNNECRKLTGVVSAENNKVLLILDNILSLDETSFYYKNNAKKNNFFSDFGSIRYTLNGKSYTTKVKLMNPSNYDNKAILQTVPGIKNAQTIDLYITIRNRQYIIGLK